MAVSAHTLISDDLLRQLVAVGQVDLVVGVPTLNHAATIGDVVRAVRTCFLQHFPRQRAVLIHSDGGSADDTVAIVRSCCADETDTVRASHSLRTWQRISTPYLPEPGRGDANRLMLRAADLLQARVVVVLDPDLDNTTPERVAALARPALDHGFDFVAPVYDRSPFDGLLVTQLLRPLLGSLFARRLHEPLASEFGCSGRFAAAWADEAVDTPAAPDGGAIWLTATALAGPFRTGQVVLGRRVAAAGRAQPTLADVFQRVVGDAFQAIEAHAGHWTTAVPAAVPTLGESLPRVQPDPARPPQEGGSLLASFADDVRNLHEILRAVIEPDSLASIVAAANEPAPRYPGPLWAATVGDFLLAHHRGVMRRDHIVQALTPLYRARAGSFLCTYGSAPEDVANAALEDLWVDFEQIRNHVVERWTTSPVR
jgi:hypothetical protein